VHQVAADGSDHLYNFLTSAGAVAAVLGLAGGVLVAILYSRRATAIVSAELVITEHGSIIAVRPSVNAIGPFKLKFADSDGAVVHVTSVQATDSGTYSDDENAKNRDAFPTDEKGKAQFVSPGEILTTSLLFRVDPSSPRLLGWLVSFHVASKGIVRHGLHWADRVFVPVSCPQLSETTGGQMPEQEKEPGQKERSGDEFLPLAAQNRVHPTSGADDAGTAEKDADQGEGDSRERK
jgi:hypothetical protein